MDGIRWSDSGRAVRTTRRGQVWPSARMPGPFEAGRERNGMSVAAPTTAPDPWASTWLLPAAVKAGESPALSSSRTATVTSPAQRRAIDRRRGIDACRHEGDPEVL